MPHYGTLQDFKFLNDIDDVRGTALYGKDNEKLGKIDDVIFDHQSGEIKYVVVDSGGWFTHKKFLVPADEVRGYDADKDAFQADLTKEQINKFPRYDEKALQSEDEWKKYEQEYKRFWAEDGAIHRKDRPDLVISPPEAHGGTDAGLGLGSMGEDITPDVASSARQDIQREMQENIANRDLTPRRIAGKFPTSAPGSGETHLVPDLNDVDEDRVVDEDVEAELNRAPEERAIISGGQQRPNRDAASERDISGAQDDLLEEDDIEVIEIAGSSEVNSDYRDVKAPSREFDTGSRDDEDVIEQNRADVGRWHPRMRRFEDVLKKNRVDVTASCASCAPAKDKAA